MSAMGRMHVYCMSCKTDQPVETIQQAEDWAAEHKHPEFYVGSTGQGMHWYHPKQSWITRLKNWLGL